MTNCTLTLILRQLIEGGLKILLTENRLTEAFIHHNSLPRRWPANESNCTTFCANKTIALCKRDPFVASSQSS